VTYIFWDVLVAVKTGEYLDLIRHNLESRRMTEWFVLERTVKDYLVQPHDVGRDIFH